MRNLNPQQFHEFQPRVATVLDSVGGQDRFGGSNGPNLGSMYSRPGSYASFGPTTAQVHARFYGADNPN